MRPRIRTHDLRHTRQALYQTAAGVASSAKSNVVGVFNHFVWIVTMVFQLIRIGFDLIEVWDLLLRKIDGLSWCCWLHSSFLATKMHSTVHIHSCPCQLVRKLFSSGQVTHQHATYLTPTTTNILYHNHGIYTFVTPFKTQLSPFQNKLKKEFSKPWALLAICMFCAFRWKKNLILFT